MSSIAVSGIAAQAFRLLELSPISSFGDDSEQGIAAADQYPVALDMCLERTDWSFASQPAQLPQVAEISGDPRLPYVFQRPADLVAMRELAPDNPFMKWRLDVDRLRTDAPGPLWCRYTARITDEVRLPGMFKTAIAHQLAALLAGRFTKTRAMAGEMQDQSDSWIERAMLADARTASPRRYDGLEDAGDWAAGAVR